MIHRFWTDRNFKCLLIITSTSLMGYFDLTPCIVLLWGQFVYIILHWCGLMDILCEQAETAFAQLFWKSATSFLREKARDWKVPLPMVQDTCSCTACSKKWCFNGKRGEKQWSPAPKCELRQEMRRSQKGISLCDLEEPGPWSIIMHKHNFQTVLSK